MQERIYTTNYRHVRNGACLKVSFGNDGILRVKTDGCEDIYFLDSLSTDELETLIASTRSAVRAMISWKDSKEVEEDE